MTSLSNVSGGTNANNRIFNIVDNVDWQRGAHSIKFGGGIEHYRNFYGIVPNYGTFTFDGSIVDDTYKVTRKLTAYLGVRWD